MELITVFRSFNPEEAELIRSRLEVAGFSATVAHDNAALTLAYGKQGGSLVQVPEGEAEEARVVLDAKE